MMDDEIDIEEHDILEHPQVKAVFPDLSKIQIQVHTGAAFLDETLAHTEVLESLLEERQDFAENDFEEGSQDIDSKLTDDDLSNTAQIHTVDLMEDNLEEEFMEETLFENDVLEKAHQNSDKNCNNDVSLIGTEIVLKHKLTYNVHETENNLVDEIQEISDDESLDNAQLCAANKVVSNADEIAIAEFDKKANEIATSSNSKDENFQKRNLIAVLVENVYEISDDEESIETEEIENVDENQNGDGFTGVAFENVLDVEKKLENSVEIVETRENGEDFDKTVENSIGIEKEQDNDVDIEAEHENSADYEKIVENGMDIEEKQENDVDIEEEQENGENFNDISENDADIEEDQGNDVDIEGTHENSDEFVREPPAFIKRQEYGIDISVVKDIPEQNGFIETSSQYSEGVTNVHEYSHAPIKEEIYDVPIKEEMDVDYETKNYTNFDETLPDETFFRNDESLPIDNHFNNKIILGSKPSPRIQSSNLSVPNRNLSFLVVLLEDWGRHLNQSHSFCHECKILFTTPNALDAHKMIAHSLLAPITNRAVKSTSKSSKGTEVKNIAKKSTGSVKNKEISNSTYCNHCNVTFKDHTSLIKHLYELLPAKNYTCIHCNVSFKSQNDLVSHNSVHVKIEPRKILKAKKNSDKNPLLRNLLNKEPKRIGPAPNSDLKTLKRSYSKPNIQSHSKTVKSQPVEIKRVSCTKYLDKWLSRYKCTVCNLILSTYSLARKHRYSHPETQIDGKRSMIFRRLTSKKASPNNSKDKITYEEDSKSSMKNLKKPKMGKIEDKSFNLIAKSALFQCSKCSVHFASCIAGTAHIAGNKCGAKPTWSCPTCKKKLRKIDEIYHRKQHEISTKLKIYKITKNTNERTLCKCLKCSVHFDYIRLKMHINKCGKIPTVKCKRCNILLARHKLSDHNMKHEVLKLKPTDFIFVDYAVVKDKTKPKPKLVANKKNNSKIIDKKPLKKTIVRQIKVEPGITAKRKPATAKKTLKTKNKLTFEKDKINVYHCKYCKRFLTRSRNIARSIKNHLSKKCSSKKNNCFFCEQCGLQFSMRTREKHEAMHTEKDLSLKDFAFYDMETLKPINPPIPEYPSCKKCKIHFLDHSLSKDHICGEDYDNCEYCGDKFELSALKVHRPFHKLQSKNHKPIQNELSPTKIIPELMMKYESLNAIWNILFICGKCELVTDLYNRAVEHSQAHLKKELSQPNTIKCYICNLKFDESCWSKHSELHSRMNINRKDFKILKYAPNQLLDESWFQMFETLPEKEIRQIIDRSVFGSERSLKMRLVKDGLPEFTVYCCSSCKVAYDNNSILDHVKSKCKVSKQICRKCDIAFDAANTLNFHELLHQKGIKKEEFRIVHFVKISNDIDTNSLNNINVKAKPKKCVVNSKKLGLEKKKRVIKQADVSQFVLYKCLVCSSCVHLKMSVGYHACTPDHHLAFCKICKQNFSFRQMRAHKMKHFQQPQFRAKNIKIIGFVPTPEEDRMLKKRPKPKKRGDSAASSKNKSKKLASKRSENDPTDLHSEIKLTSSSSSKSKARSNSKIRSSVDSFETFVNLITDEKADTSKKVYSSKRSQSLQRVSVANSDTAPEGEGIKTAKLYKCDCGLHYTSLRSIQTHIETCKNDDRISKENCSRCGLLFPTNILVSHLCKHHSQDTIITIEPVHKKSNKVEATSTQENKPKTSTTTDYVKLYKCSDCNVYFLNQTSCYKHISKHQALDPKQYIECKMCCLQFKILSLHIHMKKHHKKEFNLERVLVEEYSPSVGKQTPKIDIYFASERLQNVQVSSSND